MNRGVSQLLRRIPWMFLATALLALLIQCRHEWRAVLIYDRPAIARGEWWRLWTGHGVHFGWPHFAADTGLFLLLGWFLESARPVLARVSLVVLPVFISLVLFTLDPGLQRYGGLSGVNWGLLLYLAADGWRRQRTGWFWPGVLLLCAGELGWELTMQTGVSRGMVRFDEPGIRVATSAHLAGAAYALILFAITTWWRRRGGRVADDPGSRQ